MSKKNDLENLIFIVEKIDDLNSYVKRYEKVSLLLEDKFGADASLMCLLQIGETLNKIQNKYDLLLKEDIKGSYDVRNFIAHDYMGVDLGFIEAIIKERIPILHNNIKTIIGSLK
ncbi:MAG TPA: DUF86 domain-containing protein [Arcobacter sp.]|nr:DUF86 domain-containing protein [Arcobacter sp.]HIP55514.1 DUF86 domain-containing protein [Arcobacter sp.]